MQMLSLRSTRYAAVVFFAFALAATGSAQTTYTWNQTGSGAWTTATNWTPTRTTPAANDVLIFNNGATTTVTAVPTQTIGQLLVSGNTTVNLQGATNPTTLTIATGAGVIDPSAAGPATGSVGITFRCTTGTTSAIAADDGLHSTGPGARREGWTPSARGP